MLQVSRQMATGGMAVDRRNLDSNFHSFPSIETRTTSTHGYGHSSLNPSTLHHVTEPGPTHHHSAPPSMHRTGSPRNSRSNSLGQRETRSNPSTQIHYQNQPPPLVSYSVADDVSRAPQTLHHSLDVVPNTSTGSPRNSRSNTLIQRETHSNPSTQIHYHNLPPPLVSYSVADDTSSVQGAPQTLHHSLGVVPNISTGPTGLIPRSAPSSLTESHRNPSSISDSYTYPQGKSSIPGSAYYPSTSQRLVPQSTSPVAAPRRHPNPQPPQAQPVPKPRTRGASISRKNERLTAATLQNCRYSLEHFPTSDHENEDRHFVVDKNQSKVFAVFDGHDGDRAVQLASKYMEDYFKTESWDRVVQQNNDKTIQDALREFFKTTEREFFSNIRSYIDEKNRIQARIPQHLTSYQAYQRFPTEVKRLQELEPMLSGGCTAVVAVIANNKLYVANVGDSRAVLIFERPNGTLAARQLSVDHGVENEQELKRLASLGLDIAPIISSGRLGTQENTRSIGDYNIKEGYKNVDIICSAREQPGTAEPYVMPGMELNKNLRYLVLMSDGVYKSIEAMFSDKEVIEANKVLLNMIDQAIQKERTFTTVSDGVLDRLQKIHQDTYERSARVDSRSPLAVACRKRDDMTLVVYKF